MFPFKEKKLKENKVVRIFNDNVDSDELIWHRDKEHRIVKVVKGTGWGLQLDNEMPFVMEECFGLTSHLFKRALRGRPVSRTVTTLGS